MANKKQLKILKQAIEVWNKWREEHLDIKPNLQGATLLDAHMEGVNLREADLQEAYLREADLREADLGEADLAGADLSGANLGKADLSGTNLKRANLGGANLVEADLGGAKLEEANLRGAYLFKANLEGANLVEADLGGTDLKLADLKLTLLGDADLEGANLVEADLRESNLIRANLSHANITDVKLYGTARDDWIIDGIICDYVFWDQYGEERTPKDRDFRPGEFEELYKQLPTFEYVFEHGFTALDAVVMSRIVEAINEKHPEFELKLDSFHSRGQPHAVFTVLHKESIEDALNAVKADYEAKIKALEAERNLLDKFLTLAIKEPRTVINRLAIVEKGEITMGDKHIGRDNIEVSGQAHVNHIKTGDSFHDQAQKLIQTPLPQVEQLTTKEVCTAHYQLLSEKLADLRKAYIIEHDVEVKFKLKKKIEEAEADLNVIEQQLEALEQEGT